MPQFPALFRRAAVATVIAMLLPAGARAADHPASVPATATALHGRASSYGASRHRRSVQRLALLGGDAQATTLGTHPYENIVWNGRRHRNMCIHMTRGEAIVQLLAGDAPSDDPHGFEVYANRKYDTTSRPILAGRAIEIRTPSFPTYTGKICLGVAPKSASAEQPAQDSTR